MKMLDIKQKKTRSPIAAMIAAAAAMVPSMEVPTYYGGTGREPWSCSAKGLQKRKNRSRMQKLSRRGNRSA